MAGLVVVVVVKTVSSLVITRSTEPNRDPLVRFPPMWVIIMMTMVVMTITMIKDKTGDINHHDNVHANYKVY